MCLCVTTWATGCRRAAVSCAALQPADVGAQCKGRVRARCWRRYEYVSFVIQKFGAERCMAESNFPVDKWGTTCVQRRL